MALTVLRPALPSGRPDVETERVELLLHVAHAASRRRAAPGNTGATVDRTARVARQGEGQRNGRGLSGRDVSSRVGAYGATAHAPARPGRGAGPGQTRAAGVE